MVFRTGSKVEGFDIRENIQGKVEISPTLASGQLVAPNVPLHRLHGCIRQVAVMCIRQVAVMYTLTKSTPTGITTMF